MFDSAKKIKNIILISLLTIISLVICFQNYNSGTYLSGWDTIHSEFDFGIAFSRVLSPAFQEHQGIGAVSSQSHIGDLPRIFFLYLLSFIFSENFLRYSYVFLMLIIGPLGVYYFLKDLLTKDFDDEEDESMLFPSFIGALFYLTNLSVVQHFNIPLEMFLTLFGFLGFIFLYLSRFLKDTSKINLRNLLIVSFLISPSSHTATLFYMFILIVGVYLFVNCLIAEDRKLAIKNSIISLLLIIGVNLFWILPNVYFVLTKGVEVSNSKIHSLFSDQAYLSNLAFGNLSDISLLKNYLFIWQIWNKDRFVNLLEPWIVNLNSGIYLFGFLLFFFAVVGIGLSLVRKEKKLYSFVVIFFLSSLFIASSNSIVGNVFDFLRDNVPFMKEALRFPFNKFSTIFSFATSIFISYFIYVLFSLVQREALKITSVIFFTFFSIVYFLPAFKGELINPLMRIEFNKDYFEVFDYFKNQTEYGRVADLPIHSVYGWSYYNFGYQGAGFLWFGIDKPLMNREFDRWNVKNEDYYNEMTFALYNDNSKNLEQVLNKYQIRWLILDKNIIAPNEKPEILNYENIQKTFAGVSNLKLDKKIGENIYIYKYSPQVEFTKAGILENVSYISNENYRENFDLAYEVLGNYYSDISKEVSFGLKTPTEILNPNIISSDNENFYLKNIKNLKNVENLANVTVKDAFLEIKTLEKTATFSLPDNFDILSIDNKILTKNKTEQIRIGSTSEVKSYKSNSKGFAKDIDNFISVGSCGVESFGSKYSLDKSLGSYILTSNNISGCLNLDLRDYLKDKKFDFYTFKFKVLNQNANSYFCVLEGNSTECNKIKLQDENEFILDSLATNLVIFNEPITNLEAISAYSNIELNFLTQMNEIKLDFAPNFFERGDVLTIKKDSNLSGSLSKFGFNPRICQTDDLITLKTGVFESKEFNICDNYNIDYSSNSFHILEVKSKNISGLPLRVCLQNSETLKCDLFTALPKNKDLTSNFLLLPPFKGPHNLALTNQVIEGNKSVNEVSYISIKKVDYLDLFELKNENIRKVYVYHKAFDKGFIAFCGLLPCSYTHVLVNNWANGWLVPSDFESSNSRILVIFWPNFLSLIGIFGFILVLFFVQKWIKTPNKPIAIDKK